jgi:hypothetical protein
LVDTKRLFPDEPATILEPSAEQATQFHPAAGALVRVQVCAVACESSLPKTIESKMAE